MKKTICFLLAAALLFAVCGCGNADKWQEQYNLGVKYMDEGNYKEAVVAFKAAITIDPKRAEAYSSAAEAYTAQGDYESARKILDEGFRVTNDKSLVTDGDSAVLAGYLNDTLIKKYGFCPDGKTVDSDGIISAYCADFDGDGRQDMAVARVTHTEDGGSALETEFYKISGSSAVLAGTATGFDGYYPDSNIYIVKYNGQPCVVQLTAYGMDDYTYRGAYVQVASLKDGKAAVICTVEWHREPGYITVRAEQDGSVLFENTFDENGDGTQRSAFISDNVRKMNDVLQAYSLSCSAGGDNDMCEFNMKCSGTKFCTSTVADSASFGPAQITASNYSPWKFGPAK